MFNFVAHSFKVIFNKTRDLLLSFFSLKAQQQWKDFKIFSQDMIFPKTHLSVSFEVQESCHLKSKEFRRGLIQLVHLMKSIYLVS
jgi:hypothetical protein